MAAVQYAVPRKEGQFPELGGGPILSISSETEAKNRSVDLICNEASVESFPSPSFHIQSKSCLPSSQSAQPETIVRLTSSRNSSRIILPLSSRAFQILTRYFEFLPNQLTTTRHNAINSELLTPCPFNSTPVPLALTDQPQTSHLPAMYKSCWQS